MTRTSSRKVPNISFWQFPGLLLLLKIIHSKSIGTVFILVLVMKSEIPR